MQSFRSDGPARIAQLEKEQIQQNGQYNRQNNGNQYTSHTGNAHEKTTFLSNRREEGDG
ncbi:hypothetical protein [Planococcus sp. CP5-4_UN]|uniref:hypothetical protein n=1 Tax=Planococcus sp. CP5-4_UN TaxID=2850852 RepID=UPI001C2CA796|nr:hypothetical protein [Planococcus sp. CP5-4_UN]